MARKRRGLTEEDRAVWEKVAKSVTRSSAAEASTAKKDPLPEAAEPRTDAVPEKPAQTPFRVGERAKKSEAKHQLSPPISEQLARGRVNMDQKAFGRLKRGKLEPEARIDLHGMTQDQAHPALMRFIQDAYARQLRLVLVITGKGKRSEENGPIPRPQGVLRHQVPGWLSQPPLAQAVLQISPAHISHGGEGAYYVYLRRQR